MSPNEEIDAFVKEIFTQSGSKGSHSYDHTRRVHSLSLKIGNVVGANQRILSAAALLHDIGRIREKETGVTHSILSGEMSESFLRKNGYSKDEIEHITDVIRTHRFSEGLTPNSIEGEVLSDADKLDAMGTIGVYRGIAYATETGTGVEGFLNHADEKLLKLRDLMYTAEGKRMAELRHSNLERFVHLLRKELEI